MAVSGTIPESGRVLAVHTDNGAQGVWTMDVDYGHGHVDYGVLPREVAEVVSPDHDRQVLGAAAGSVQVGDVSVMPGDLVRYGGQAKGATSTAKVVRIARDVNPQTPDVPSWIIEAETTLDSRAPGRTVWLTPARVGDTLVKEGRAPFAGRSSKGGYLTHSGASSAGPEPVWTARRVKPRSGRRAQSREVRNGGRTRHRRRTSGRPGREAGGAPRGPSG